MQYAILIYETASDFETRDDPARAPAYWAAWTNYSKALQNAGVTRGGAGLEPPRDATTLRVRRGERIVQDGPFADAKEELGGFFLVEAPNLDVALEWAAKCPAASSGAVEVRPCLPPPPGAGAQ